MKTSIRHLGGLMFAACAIFVSACASEGGKPKPSAKVDEPDTAPAAKEPEKPRKEPQTGGRKHIVTTTLSNENVLEGSVSSETLSNVLFTLDEVARKEPDNVPVLITYLSLLRLSGESPEIYQRIERQAGFLGAKDVWFTLEAGYGALRRKEYALADYLFAKAKENARSDQIARSAVDHAFAIRYLIEGKTQVGVVEMRKAARAGYLPSLLTLGFLALRSGDYAGGETFFRQATQSAPQSVNARVGLAAALRVRGKSDDAANILQGIYKQRSSDRRVVWNYALSLADAPRSRGEAKQVLDKYFELPGSIPDIDAKASTLMDRLSRAADAGDGAKKAGSGASRDAGPLEPGSKDPEGGNGTSEGDPVADKVLKEPPVGMTSQNDGVETR